MKQEKDLTGEIVIYQPDETIRLEVKIEDETVWLSQQLHRKVVSLHQ